jgi:cytochrome d ubiquinol oxidase subunit II
MEILPVVWFILIAVLWVGYLFLEGFDLGVGMAMKVFAKDERERRLLLNTIGPVWDGNEVWLLTAGGATFAAFPMWYASLFSALYVPLTLTLVALIFRAVAIEYRGKTNSAKLRNAWDWALAAGSFFIAFGVGAMLALSTTGLPLNANGDRVGGPFVWLNAYAVLGGLGVVLFAFAHGLAFIGLKTAGDVQVRAAKWLSRALPWAILPLAAWAFIVVVRSANVWPWIPLVLAVLALVFSWIMALRERDGWAFIGLGLILVVGVTSIFGGAFPNVLPSTIDAANNLTVFTASSTPYTLKVMTIVACFGVPIVLGYQAWSYWVFSKRISIHHIPAQHVVSSTV